MQQKKRSKWWLFTGLFLFLTLGYVLYAVAPSTVFSTPFSMIKPIHMIFLLAFVSLSMISTYLLHRKRRGILVGLFVCGYFALRYNNFTDPLFVILLLAFFLSIEIVFSKLHF